MKKIFIICSLISSYLSAQDVDQLISEYPNEDIVGIHLNERIDISLANNTPKVTRLVSKQNLFITNDKRNFIEEGIYFDKFRKISTISAHTNNTSNNLKKEKGSNRSIWDVEDFSDKDILSRGVFFGDSKQKTFTYPAVGKKSITNLNYKVDVLDPHFISPFYLNNRYPIKEATFSILVDNTIDLAYKTYNLDSVSVAFNKTLEGDKTRYTWAFNRLEKANFNYDFSPIYYLPQIAVYIKSYTINGQKNTVLNDVKDLYSWYQSLIKNINKINQAQLKTITESLIKGLNSDEEKIKAIYYFVQDKINYIAFEDGLNGFIPRDAMSVYHKRYGDCKDMANILNEMLHYANIPSYLTWIGTRDKPYSYYDLPTTYTDNHMITAVKYQEQFLFLDATAKYLPFGYPSPFIQGKEALVGLSKEDFKIQPVEEVAKEKNFKEIKSVLDLNEALELRGQFKTTLTGYRKLDFNHKYSNKKDNDKDFVRENFKLGSRKSSFNNESYSDTSLKNDSIYVAFEGHFPNYVREINGDLFVKLNIDNDLKKELVKDKQKLYDKKIDYKYLTKHQVVFKIPDGYTISSLPEPIGFDHEDYGFKTTYKQQNNTVILDKTIFTNTLRITPKDIKTWNSFIKKLSKSNKKSIILKKL